MRKREREWVSPIPFFCSVQLAGGLVTVMMRRWIAKLKTWWLGGAELSTAEKELLTAVAQGDTLKSHRHLDGQKEYKRWPANPDEPPTAVPYELVQSLLDKKLITTNQKFPAATFLLTTAGKDLVAQWDKAIRGLGDVVNF